MRLKLINKNKAAKGTQYIAIERDSVFGNPYVMQDQTQSERDRVCSEYERYFKEEMSKPESILYKAVHDLLDALIEGEQVTLGCSCKPKRCHGDTIVSYLQAKYDQALRHGYTFQIVDHKGRHWHYEDEEEAKRIWRPYSDAWDLLAVGNGHTLQWDGECWT